MRRPWEVATDPRGGRFTLKAYRLGVYERPIYLLGYIVAGLSWLLHWTWFRGRWRVKVTPHGGDGWWKSSPLDDEDAAAEVLYRALDLIEAGAWPPKGAEDAEDGWHYASPASSYAGISAALLGHRGQSVHVAGNFPAAVHRPIGMLSRPGMPRPRALALAALACLGSACSESHTAEESDEQAPRVWLFPTTGEGEQAGLHGTLAYDSEHDCLFVRESREAVVWPAGTVGTAEGPGVVLPSGDTARVGDRIAGTGGHHPGDTFAASYGISPECVTESLMVFQFSAISVNP
jgi:hypothetical protein